jgi:hypothetical protein
MKSASKNNKKLPKTPKVRAKVKKVMEEYKEGELDIGKSSKPVKSRKQAVAIALSEARKAVSKKKK